MCKDFFTFCKIVACTSHSVPSGRRGGGGGAGIETRRGVCGNVDSHNLSWGFGERIMERRKVIQERLQRPTSIAQNLN